MTALVDALLPGATPFDLAAREAARADRLAGAFVPGYRAALRVLAPGLDPRERLALCATEAGGAHPRGVATRYDGRAVTGEKRWVTGARDATTLLVLCVAGETALGRKDLRLVAVDAAAPGVSLSEAPPPPFVPEVSHATVRLDAAPARAELPGEGWGDYVRPFRTIEDAHVLGASHAYALGWTGRGGADGALREPLAAGLVLLRAIAAMDPRAAATHIALAGAIAASERALADLDGWAASLGDEESARWSRDRALLSVASRARAQRTARAWALAPR